MQRRGAQATGAAARLVHEGDLIIVLAFGMFDEREVAAHKPAIVFVDERNRPVRTGTVG